MRARVWFARLLGVALAAGIAAASPAEARALQEQTAKEKKEKEKEKEKEEARRTSQADVITPLLRQRLQGKASWDDVIVDIRWPFDGLYTSTRIYGDGVAVWQRELQIRLARADVRKLLEALVKARFGSMPIEQGGDESQGERTLKGRIAVSVGPVTKIASQFEHGEQSAALQKIAEDFLKLSKKAAAKGIGISSFSDGFEKLASGTLEPESLSMDVRVNAAATGEESWRLRINGRRLIDQDLAKSGGRASARTLVLSDKDFRAFAQALAAADVAALPLNLYADRYTDVEFRLLHKFKHVQARRFAGMTPLSNGDKQIAFDRLFAAITTLHDRTEKEGQRIEVPDQSRAEAEERERRQEEEKREQEEREQRRKTPSVAPTPASPAGS